MLVHSALDPAPVSKRDVVLIAFNVGVIVLLIVFRLTLRITDILARIVEALSADEKALLAPRERPNKAPEPTPPSVTPRASKRISK